MSKVIIFFTACALLYSSASFAQQPGTPQYNSVYLPGHGVGDTKAPPRIWGAWARGDDRTLGYSLTGRTQQEAEDLAVADCERRGSTNCVPIDSFDNACVAIAAGPSDRYAQISRKGTKWTRREALKQCGPDCKIIFEGCAVP
ncbi:DUF4189 domain-containing protein [Stenotrophomonas sp.]|uniref:DUF4189 domain-containing protein n=1 Tax=unclassified Stenotrophomonas TaxID=196198 RepID=UPI0039C94C06